jgi:hypothetical protein
VAVKKKSAAKKAAPKKSTAKKSTAKKSAVKKAAKKSPAKKTAAKKKSAVKKTTAKKAVKKTTAKKATTKKKTVKKSAARKSASSQVVIPPVPSIGSSSSSRVNVSTTPAPATPRPAAGGSKPAAKNPNSSKVLFAVLVGILVIGAFVISGSDKDGDDAPAPVPAVSETAAPEETMEATESATPAATTGEAPSRFIGNWKDTSETVMVLTWKAPMGDIKGYKIETRSNYGEWKVVSEVSATTFSAEFAKGSADGSTSFRVSAVYADGTLGVATPFGFAGQFE